MAMPRFLHVWHWLLPSHRQAARTAARAADQRRDIQRKQIVMMQLGDMLRNNGREQKPGRGHRTR